MYLEGARNLIEWLSPDPPKKFVYTSSTSVYGQTNGSAVKETSPTEPSSETSKILVETEKLLLEAASEKKLPAVILRVAGVDALARRRTERRPLSLSKAITGRS